MVALGWPVDAEGAPLPGIGDEGPPLWNRWAEVFQIFKADGSPPEPWNGTSRSVPDIGAIELKLAWKVVDAARDDLGRYMSMPAYVPSGPHDPHWQPAAMGLVGFHIAQKTESPPQWIWSTFEHVDNVEVDLLDAVMVNGEETPLLPSFNDSYCAWCPVNVVPAPDEEGVSRTQGHPARADHGHDAAPQRLDAGAARRARVTAAVLRARRRATAGVPGAAAGGSIGPLHLPSVAPTLVCGDGILRDSGCLPEKTLDRALQIPYFRCAYGRRSLINDRG